MMVLSLASVALMGEAEALPASSSSSESCMIFLGPLRVIVVYKVLWISLRLWGDLKGREVN